MVIVLAASVGIVSGTPHCWPAAIDTAGSVPVPTDAAGMDDRGPLFNGPETDVEPADVEPAEPAELSVLDPQADTTSSNDDVAASSRRIGCRLVTATPRAHERCQAS
jgi:hypothetical protein